MAGAGGGAWKVAYADFVTAMMAFFMVMWIVAQGKPVKEAVAGYFNDPTGYAKRNGNGKSQGLLSKDGAATQTSKGAPSKSPGGQTPTHSGESDSGHGVARKPSLLGIHDGSNLAVEMLVPFGEESAELTDRGKQVLDRLSGELLGKLSKVEIRGHTSSRPIPKDSVYRDAWEMSYARSVAAMKYLVEKGVEPRRIRLSQAAANEPSAVPSVDGNPLAKNARVEVFVLSELAAELQDAGKDRHDTPAKKPKKVPRTRTPFRSGETDGDSEASESKHG